MHGFSRRQVAQKKGKHFAPRCAVSAITSDAKYGEGVKSVKLNEVGRRFLEVGQC